MTAASPNKESRTPDPSGKGSPSFPACVFMTGLLRIDEAKRQLVLGRSFVPSHNQRLHESTFWPHLQTQLLSEGRKE